MQDAEQEKLLLIAMIEDLLRRELALREEGMLVFPSQSTKENPDLPDPEGKAAIFTFEGPVLNMYATLEVRLAGRGGMRCTLCRWGDDFMLLFTSLEVSGKKVETLRPTICV